ncbi:PIN domain-containing protein [Cellulophaga baltica]|uniref:PIN domain-containing protein n=1 Tax=Cellulophaga baltica TaxID=76594 RepID=UPI0037CAE8B3
MSDKKDIFYLDKIFPDSSKIFSFEYKPLDELVDNSIFILDTNVLFVPFDTSEKNLEDIKNILLKIKEENKLFLPARVAREFANNRAKRLGDLFLKLRQTKDNLNSGNYKSEDYPLLQGNSNYKEVLESFEKISELIKTSRKLLNKVESDILSWNWNDNVSKTYKAIFTEDIIIEVEKSKEDLIKDLEYRIEHKIAPGYKDSNKLDDGIGDLIIWQTAMEIAKAKKMNLILVSNDQKNDWFYKQDKTGLYPKYELFDEFRRFTDGLSLQIINFPKFLEIQHARAETIKEVRDSIKKVNTKKKSFLINLSSDDLAVGLMVDHRRFGLGIIKELDKEKVLVDFNENGMKKLLIRFSPMNILNNSHNFHIKNPDFDGDPKTYQLLDLDE